jgi:hypothetical protein
MISRVDPGAYSSDVFVGRYRFFGRGVELVSDDSTIVRALDLVYARQRWVAPSPEPQTSRRRSGLESPEELVRVYAFAKEVPEVRVGGRTIRVPEADQLAHYAHLIVINVAAALATGATVLHSGAVSRGGQAALLVGSSGHGKTTLTLELVRRGWRFLSDDFAPVDAAGVVRPFPRRVNVTDATLVLLGLSAPADGMRLAGFGVRASG